MNQFAVKLNKAKNIKPVKIIIQLTPAQIIQAYQELIKQEGRIKDDWIYQEPFVSELKSRVKIAGEEKKIINWFLLLNFIKNWVFKISFPYAFLWLTLYSILLLPKKTSKVYPEKL